MILVPSHGRPRRMTTPRLLDDCDWRVLVHDGQFEDYFEVWDWRTIDTGTKPGSKMDSVWAVLEHVPVNEWVAVLDDDITAIKGRHGNLQGRELSMLFDTIARTAEARGARLAGLTWVEEDFQRARRWQTARFALGGLFLLKNTADKMKPETRLHDDTELSASYLVEDGIVLTDGWHLSVGQEYGPGGYGDVVTRETEKADATRSLLRKWPGLFAVHDRELPDGTILKYDVRMRHDNEEDFARWRQRWMQRRTTARR